MPFRRPHARAFLALLSCCLVFSACGFGLSKRGAPVPDLSAKISYGSGIADDAIDVKEIKQAKRGTLVMRLSDSKRRPIAGAYVQWRGEGSNGKRATGSDGIMKVNLPPGKYVVDLPPCGKTVMPLEPGTTDVVIVAGRTAFADLPKLPWKRRFAPAPSVETSEDPPWERGRNITLGVRIEDGCDFLEAPGASVSMYRWRASSNFAFVRYPSRADGEGYARVTVRCTARGNGSIVIYDPLISGVAVDLLEAASGRGADDTWCD